MAGKEAGLIQPSWPRPPLACRVTSASYLTSGSFHGWNMLGVPVALSEYMEVLGATPTHHLVQSACTHGPWHWPPHCVVRSADFLEHPCLKSSEPGACFRFRVSLSLCPSLACTHGAALSPNRDPVGQQWWNKAPPLAKGVSATSQSPQPLHMGPCPPPPNPWTGCMGVGDSWPHAVSGLGEETQGSGKGDPVPGGKPSQCWSHDARQP